MHNPWGKQIVFDSSTLINFLAIDRVDLLLPLVPVPIVTDVVRAEISERFQCNLLEAALTAEIFYEITLSTPQELQSFRDFINEGLGRGESASIVAAHKLHLPLALDDKVATKRARRAHPKQVLVTTKDIILTAINYGLLTITEADKIKDIWKANHRFTLPFESFADLRL